LPAQAHLRIRGAAEVVVAVVPDGDVPFVFTIGMFTSPNTAHTVRELSIGCKLPPYPDTSPVCRIGFGFCDSVSLLACDFTRIHRSHAVNIGAVRELRPLLHGEYRLTLANRVEVTSGRSYRGVIQAAFGFG